MNQISREDKRLAILFFIWFGGYILFRVLDFYALYDGYSLDEAVNSPLELSLLVTLINPLGILYLVVTGHAFTTWKKIVFLFIILPFVFFSGTLKAYQFAIDIWHWDAWFAYVAFFGYYVLFAIWILVEVFMTRDEEQENIEVNEDTSFYSKIDNKGEDEPFKVFTSDEIQYNDKKLDKKLFYLDVIEYYNHRKLYPIVKFIEPIYLRDREIIVKLMQKDVRSFRYVLKNIFYDKSFLKRLLEVNPAIFPHFPKALKEDREMVYLAVFNDHANMLYIGDCIEFGNSKKERELILSTLKSSYKYLRYFPERFQNESSLMVGLFNCDPLILQYLPKYLTQDKKLVTKAIQYQPRLFEYADITLRDDDMFVKLVNPLLSSAFEYMSNRLKNDSEFVQELFVENRYLIRYLEKDVIKKHLAQYPDDVKYLNRRQKADASLHETLSRFKKKGKKSHKKSFTDEEKDRVNRKKWRTKVKENSRNFYDIPALLKKDRAFLKTLLTLDTYVLNYFPDKFKDDKEIALLSLNKNPLSLCDVSQRLQNDKEVVFSAVLRDSSVLEYAHSNFKKNKELTSFLRKLDNEIVSYQNNTKLSDFDLSIDNEELEEEYVFENMEYDSNNKRVFFERYEWNKDKSLKSLRVGFSDILFSINIRNNGLYSLKIEEEYFKELKNLEKKAHFPLFQNFGFLTGLPVYEHSLTLEGKGIFDVVAYYLPMAINKINKINNNFELTIKNTSLSQFSYAQFLKCNTIERVIFLVNDSTEELKEFLEKSYREYVEKKSFFQLAIDNKCYFGEPNGLCPSYSKEKKEFKMIWGSSENYILDVGYFLEHYTDEVRTIVLEYFHEFDDGSFFICEGTFSSFVSGFQNISFPELERLELGECHPCDDSGIPVQNIGDLTLLLQNMPKLTSLYLYGCYFTLTPYAFPTEKIELFYSNEDTSTFQEEDYTFSVETILLGREIFDNNDWFLKLNAEMVQLSIVDKSVEISFFDLEEIVLEDFYEVDVVRGVESFSDLESLDISYNKLKTLPKEIGNFTKLLALWLSSNNLESLPDEVCELINLNTLTLDNNPNLELNEKQVEWIKALQSRGCYVDLDKHLMEKYGLDGF